MEKVKSILSTEEIQRFVDLGLGRGVDSTNPRPWLNKTSFQVRNVTFSNVIGTDEGGFVQTFKSHIASNTDLQSQFKASASVPNTPVSFGLEGEASRSSSSSKKIVGKKVVNRTISFRIDPHSTPESPLREDETTDVEDDKSYIISSKMQPTFEEAISAWIWKEISDRKGLKANKKEAEMKGKSITCLDEYLRDASKEDISIVVEDCAEFIRSFGVTHYVSSITLGASEHTVMTESEYSTILKEGSNVTAAQIASAQQKLTMKSKSSKTASIKQYIGRMLDDKVEKSSTDEAVIEVKILPIHSLVHNQLIRLALHKALMEYADDRTIQQTGPYVVECGDEQMYWKVESIDCNYLLTITKDFKQASLFHVIPDDETDDAYDFIIAWQGETLQDIVDQDDVVAVAKASSKIMRYLEVKTYFFGHYPGPLMLKSELSAKDSRLCLYNQIKHDYFDSPADFTPWITDKKVFFISSANSKSFITVQRYGRSMQADAVSEDAFEYKTKCVGSQKLHNEKNTWMLFRLLPADTAQVQQSKRISIFEGSQKKMSEKLTKLLETS